MTAVEPAALVERHLQQQQPQTATDRYLVVGAGKAAARMARGCEVVLGERRVHGLIIVADGCECSLTGLQVHPAGHPLPDERGMIGTERLCRALEVNESDPVI